jgi:Fe2+ or Zn2+ uptake regulation protein
MISYPVSARLQILAYLETHKKAGATYALTAKGISDGAGLPLPTVLRGMRCLKTEGLVMASKSIIVGKSRGYSSKTRPNIYEISPTGMEALEEARKALRRPQ